MRLLLPAMALVLACVMLSPSAAAQPKPVIHVKIKWAMEHEEMVLDETGRGDMGMVVEAFGEDFVCSSAYKFRVELDIKELPKVYGSSMVPKVVPTGDRFFYFDAGKVGYKPASPGDKAMNSPNSDANLNMAWDLDGVPRTGAKFDYVIKGTVKPEGGAACSPTPEFRVADSPMMTVRMMDRPAPGNGTPDDPRCMDNPSAPGCVASATPEVPVGAPGPGPALLLLMGIAWLTLVRRRRT